MVSRVYIEEKLFTTLVGSYHDSVLENAVYKDGSLYMYCFRNPPNPDGAENPNFRYVIIRFDNVGVIELFDWDSKTYKPYSGENTDINTALTTVDYIDYLDYEDGFVVFGECLRLRCENVSLLVNSCSELAFEKYC